MPYDKWVRFNNAQRAHANMVEQSAPVLACIAGAGLFYPKLSAGLGFSFAVGRVLYAIGYNSNKGADGRLVGVIVAELATVALFGISIYAGAMQSNLVDLVKGLIA